MYGSSWNTKTQFNALLYVIGRTENNLVSEGLWRNVLLILVVQGKGFSFWYFLTKCSVSFHLKEVSVTWFYFVFLFCFLSSVLCFNVFCALFLNLQIYTWAISGTSNRVICDKLTLWIYLSCYFINVFL